MAVLLGGEGYKSSKWSELGRTDTVANSLSEQGRTGCFPVPCLCCASSLPPPVCPCLLTPHPPPTPPSAADPEFRKALRCTYNFEKLQPMRLQMYDVDVKERDNRKLRLPEQDFLGGWVDGVPAGYHANHLSEQIVLPRS
jgi:hypothetical protein